MDPLSVGNNTNTKNIIISIIVIVLLIILAAILAASETAFSKANRYKIQSLKEEGSKKASCLLKILDNYDKSIIDTLIWINISHIVASTLATYLLISLTYNESLSSILSTIIMTLILFFFSELLPKNIANINPDKTALNLAYFIKFLGYIIYPISLIFNLLIKLLKNLFKVKDIDNSLSEDDFQDTVEDIGDDGLLEDEEVNIISNAVDFGDTTVLKVLTKTSDIVLIDVNIKKEDLLKFIENVNYTRIPVYEDSVDNIIGVLHIKNYLLKYLDNPNISLRKNLYKPLFLNENTSLDDCVDIFQEKHNHMAFVKSNDNILLGMITLEDVVEELVGDIDELNPPRVLLKGGKK